MEAFNSDKGVSLYAYKGDAMTLLAFDLAKELTDNFVGFTIHVKAGSRRFYLYNKLTFKKGITLHRQPKDDDEKLSTEFSPIQKFRWVHVPSSIHYVDNPFFGDYTYSVTPRYVVNGSLLKPDTRLTVSITIEVSPFKDGSVRLGFTRAFVSSQAYTFHFGTNAKMRPNNTDLIFDIKAKSGTATRKGVKVDYTYEEQHEYLGWQARDRVMEFLDEVVQNKRLKLDVFAYDLNEPVIASKLITLGKQGRVRIILDNTAEHVKAGCFEMRFDKLFRQRAKSENQIFRGNFAGLAHAKVFIKRKNSKAGKAVSVLTGSTNFTTNGLCINANHAIIFDHARVAQLYADVFDASFGENQMASFKNSDFAAKDFEFKGDGLPDMTIRFSPHPKKITDTFFASIAKRIKEAESDVLFAIMMDNSKSDILKAVQEQVKSDAIFTYGISDKKEGISLYKPGSKRGIKVTGLGTATDLPFPFSKVAKIPGHNIHHKFIIVDFKGKDPVVYCGSSNLAYTPEQHNGDNLLAIRDKDVVAAFAIEAIRLVDHFQWRNKEMTAEQKNEGIFLRSNIEDKKWYAAYYHENDLYFLERTLLMK